MGLFNKTGGTGKQKKAVEPKKGKKALFGGKKKDMTLIERMQLEESVAAASLDVVQDLADNGNAAVREVEDGLLIVVFTNANLETAGLDPESEEFGSFAEALRSETVESIALADDLAEGIIGIIPSQETLLSLDEFDFVQDLPFQWAIVPFDLDDSDRLTVLNDTVDLARLVEIANDASIKLDVQNGEVVTISGGDNFDENEETFVEEDEDDDDAYPEDDELPEDDDELDDEFDAGVPAVDIYGDNFEDDEPSNTYGEIPQDDGFDDELDDEPFTFDDDDLDADDGDAEYVVDEELMSVEESKEAINRAVNHSFNNTELNLSIDMSKFDDYFDAVTLAQFDTTKVDNSELQNVLSKLRQDANTELSRFHQDNIQSLRNRFTTSMRDIHNRLVESLDHKDEGTTYGERYYSIEDKFSEAMRDIDRQVAAEIGKLTAQYKEAREEYGENAKREAYSVYDTRYKSDLDRKTAAIRTSVPADLKTERDTNLGELYQDRRTIAQRLFDKATTALLQTLQGEHQNISHNELRMYDAFRKDMDVYLRRHFADEVLRAKAEAEKLRQSHEAERVRSEYEQMLLTKARQLEEADRLARAGVNQLESAHREQLDKVKADYDNRILREQKDNDDLRKMLNDATENISKVGAEKVKEVTHQMKVLEDQVKAKEKELEYANQRNARSQKPMWLLTAGIAALFLAFGVIAGFLSGAGSVEYAPQAPVEQAAPAEQSDETSYFNAPSEELFVTEYDYQDAA